MRIGLFLGYQRIHPPSAYEGNLYEEMLQMALEADRSGFDILWLPEHHLIHLQQAPSVAVLATHIGTQVKCKIGTMVALPNYRHPLITAGELALVHNVLGGRLEIGVGRGAYEYEFERLNIPFAEGKERLAEALDVLERIWCSEDAISYEGRFTSFDDAHVWPRPLRRPHPPLWVAAMTPPTIDWAVRAGYSVANWPFVRDIEVVAETARAFHRTREAMGVPRGQQRLGILRGAYVADTEAAAAAAIADVLIGHRINQRLRNFTQNSDKLGYVSPEPGDDEPTSEDIYRNLIMGTPEQCLEKLEQYHEIGVDDLLIALSPRAGSDGERSSLRLFAEEVIHPFRMRHPEASVTASAGVAAPPAPVGRP